MGVDFCGTCFWSLGSGARLVSVSGLSRSSRMRLLAEGQWDVDRTADCR